MRPNRNPQSSIVIAVRFFACVIFAVNISAQPCNPSQIGVSHEVIENRIGGLIGPRSIYILTGELNFTEKILTKLFQCFSSLHSDEVLMITVSSDREDIQRTADEDKSPTPYLPDAVLARKVVEEQLREYNRQDDHILKASYVRNRSNEHFSFKRKDKGVYTTVTIRDQDKFVETDKFLFRSIHVGHRAAVEWFLERRKNANIKDSNDNTPLITAVAFSRDEIVEIILRFGGEVNVSNNAGVTPLMYAVDTENENTVRLLIGKGANVNAADRFGLTPLMAASSLCNVPIVTLLLKKGAKMAMKNLKGESAMSLACNDGMKKLLSTYTSL